MSTNPLPVTPAKKENFCCGNTRNKATLDAPQWLGEQGQGNLLEAALMLLGGADQQPPSAASPAAHKSTPVCSSTAFSSFTHCSHSQCREAGVTSLCEGNTLFHCSC